MLSSQNRSKDLWECISPLCRDLPRASELVVGCPCSGGATHAHRGCPGSGRRYSLARHLRSVSHHGPLLLIGGNFNIVAVASVIAVPE